MDKQYLVEIYKVEAEKYNKTRDIHWKINIAIWTVLVLAIYTVSQNKVLIKSVYFEVMAALFYLIIHFLFVREIHGSLKRSLTRMHNIASELLDEKKEPKITWQGFSEKIPMDTGIWEYLQLVMTVFLIGIYFLIKYGR
jgi:hypothetical protein